MTADATDVSLIKAIQRSLADAQCYDGAIDGEWNGNTQQAMERAVAATRGSVPASQPTPQLLDLLRSTVSLRSACAPLQEASVSSPPAASSPEAEAAPLTDAAPKIGVSQEPKRSRKVDSAFRHPLGPL